jgi:hypothetical protein
MRDRGDKTCYLCANPARIYNPSGQVWYCSQACSRIDRTHRHLHRQASEERP